MVVGGGQLGRMSALAAAELGYRVHVFTPEDRSPAAQVSSASTVAAYEDDAALKAFAEKVDVVTFEFENMPRKAPSFWKRSGRCSLARRRSTFAVTGCAKRNS